MTFQEAVRSKNFEEALAMVQRGDDLLKSDFIFQLSDSFGPLLQGGAFDVISAMIDEESFSMDTFDYESFNKTIFQAVIDMLPRAGRSFTNTVDQESLAEFLASFLTRVEGLNDALQGDTILGLALKGGVVADMVQVMVDSGCDPSLLGRGDETYLHLLANNSPSMVDEQNLTALMQLLIDQGVDIDTKDINGNTPLIIATTQNLSCAVELLLNNGANVDEKNAKGESALSEAQKRAQMGDSTLINLITQYGSADEDDLLAQCYEAISRVENGEPLKEPSESDLEWLDQFSGVDIFLPVQDPWGQETSIANELVKKGSALFKKCIDLFEIDPTYIDSDGNTILHKLCGVDVNFEEKKARALVSIAKILLKMGADPSIRNNDDKTAVDLASDSNHKEKLVVLLLRAKK